MTKVYSRNHPLRSAYIKIRRAKVHIDGLKRRIGRFRAMYPAPTVTEKHDNNGPLEVTTFDGPHPPDTWGGIWGDIVGDLRDSLDHIAWQMRIPDPLSDREERAIYFPLVDKQPSWSGFLSNRRGDGSRKGLELFRAKFHTTIEKFQPYNRTNWAELELLSMLEKLASTDKHRVISPASGVANLSLLPASDVIIPFSLKQQGPSVFAAMISARNMPNAFNPQFAIGVGFSIDAQETGPAFSYYTIDHLSLIHDFIRAHVLPEFASLFP